MQPAQTSQGQQVPTEPLRRRISNFLARTVDRFRVALWVILITAAVLLVAYFIYNEVNRKLISDATMLAEGAESIYSSWQSESDAAKKATLEKDLKAQLDQLIGRFARQYGGQRGLFIRAELSFQAKAWDAALKDYESLAVTFPKSYLAPVSLFDAAICSEEKGDRDNAQRLYVKAYESFPESTVAPRAIFNAARLDEEKSAWAEAQKRYELIDSQYSQSEWNKLAKNRLIQLKVLGKIK
jgi:tetratricopeptide (TPR) repeat protein